MIAGKGHETTQEFADRACHFDDREVVARASCSPRAAGSGAAARRRGRRIVIAIFTAGGVAILVAGFGTPILLRWLTRRRIGQQIREDGPARHAARPGRRRWAGSR